MTTLILSRLLLRKGQLSSRCLAGVANRDVESPKTKVSKRSTSKRVKAYRNLELASDQDELLLSPLSRIESGFEGPQREKSRQGPFPWLQNEENQPARVLPEDSGQSKGKTSLTSDTLPIQKRILTGRARDDAENYPARPDPATSLPGRHPSDDEGLHAAQLCAQSHDIASLNKLLETRRREDGLPDSSTLTDMAETMAQTGFVAGVEAVEEELRARSRDARLYGALIAANFNDGSYGRVQSLYDKLQYEGHTPTEHMLRLVVISYFRTARTSSIQAQLDRARRQFKLNIDKELGGALIEGYLNAQMDESAWNVYTSCLVEQVRLHDSTLNEMALAFARSGNIDKGCEVLASIDPGSPSYPSEETLAAILFVLARETEQHRTSSVIAMAANRGYAGATFRKALLEASVASGCSVAALGELGKASKERTLTDFERAVEFWAHGDQGAIGDADLYSVRGALPRELDGETKPVMQRALDTLFRRSVGEEDVSTLLKLWQLTKEYGLAVDTTLLADVASVYARAGQLDAALDVIDASELKDARAHLDVVRACIVHRDVSVLRAVLQRARRLPLAADETVCAAEIWMSGYDGKLESAFSLFGEAIRRHGPRGCPECHSALLTVYAERALEGEALLQFSRMQHLGIVPLPKAYASVAQMYLRAGELTRAGKILERMCSDNIVPDQATVRGFVALLLSTPAMSSIQAVLDEIQRLNLRIDTETGNEILKRCAEQGSADGARSAMMDLDRVGAHLNSMSYSHLIEVGRKAKDGALLRLTGSEMPRTRSTVTALIRAFLELGADQGVIDEYRKSPALLPRDHDLLHLVSQAFERAGEMDEALNIELEVQRIRLVTWARRGNRRPATTPLFVGGGPGAAHLKTATADPSATALDSTLAINYLISDSESGEAERTALELCRKSSTEELTSCLEGLGEENWRSFAMGTLGRVLESYLEFSRAQNRTGTPAPSQRSGLLLSAEAWGHLCASIERNHYADLAPKLSRALIACDVHPRMENAQFVLGALTRQGMTAHADLFLGYCMKCYERDSSALNVLARDAIAARLQLQDYPRAARVLTSLRSLWNAEVEDSTELLLLRAGLASSSARGEKESSDSSLVDMVVHGRSASEARSLMSKLVEGASHSGNVGLAIAAQKHMARLGLELLPGAHGALLNAVDQSGEEHELRPVD